MSHILNESHSELWLRGVLTPTAIKPVSSIERAGCAKSVNTTMLTKESRGITDEHSVPPASSVAPLCKERGNILERDVTKNAWPEGLLIPASAYPSARGACPGWFSQTLLQRRRGSGVALNGSFQQHFRDEEKPTGESISRLNHHPEGVKSRKREEKNVSAAMHASQRAREFVFGASSVFSHYKFSSVITRVHYFSCRCAALLDVHRNSLLLGVVWECNVFFYSFNSTKYCDKHSLSTFLYVHWKPKGRFLTHFEYKIAQC